MMRVLQLDHTKDPTKTEKAVREEVWFRFFVLSRLFCS